MSFKKISIAAALAVLSASEHAEALAPPKTEDSVGFEAKLIGVAADTLWIEVLLRSKGPVIEFSTTDIASETVGIDYFRKRSVPSTDSGAFYSGGMGGVHVSSHRTDGRNRRNALRLGPGDSFGRTVALPLSRLGLTKAEWKGFRCSTLDSLMDIHVTLDLRVRKPGVEKPVRLDLRAPLATQPCREIPRKEIGRLRG